MARHRRSRSCRTSVAALDQALLLAKADDRPAWRTTEQQLRQLYVDGIFAWRRENENPSLTKADELVEWAAKLVIPLLPRIAFALGGVLSQKEPFVDQRRTLEQLIQVAGWNEGGTVISLNAPRMIGFVFHYLHGALACEIDRLDLALRMAQTTVPDRDENKQRPVWRSWQLAGHPKTLNDKSTLVTEFMRRLYTRDPVVTKLFGSQRDYEIAFGAYSILLSILEMAASADQHAALTDEQLRGSLMVEVAPLFITLDRDIIRAAARRSVGNSSAVEAIMHATGTKRTLLVAVWTKWKRILHTYQSEPWPDELPLGDLA